MRMNWQKFQRFSQKKLMSESLDNDNKLTLKSFFAFCSVFFFHKDQRRKDGNDFEKDTVPDFPKYTSVTLKRLNFQHSILHYIKELNLTELLVLTK